MWNGGLQNIVKSMSNELHIAVSCNERYVPGALVAMSGIAVNANEETPLVFHVFTEDVKPESLLFVRETLTRLHPKSTLVEHVCDEKLLAGLPYWAGSRMAAVRCFYADLMPEVDWCLYLDCDVLYLSSVEEHFSLKDDTVYACVVQEESAGTRQSECKWIAENCGVVITDEKYFNSGVVLFNFNKMREDGVPDKLLRFFAEHPDVPSPDQDALNATFNGCIKMIPPKFDRLQIYLTDEKLLELPAIHYVCGNPWLPKYGEVASGRFRLWHRFADKYIWQKKGESYRRCFSRKMLIVKYISYCLLKLPLVGMFFARLLFSLKLIGKSCEWRNVQVGSDISLGAWKDVIK